MSKKNLERTGFLKAYSEEELAKAHLKVDDDGNLVFLEDEVDEYTPEEELMPPVFIPTCKYFTAAVAVQDVLPAPDYPYDRGNTHHTCTNPDLNRQGYLACSVSAEQPTCQKYSPEAPVQMRIARNEAQEIGLRMRRVNMGAALYEITDGPADKAVVYLSDPNEASANENFVALVAERQMTEEAVAGAPEPPSFIQSLMA